MDTREWRKNIREKEAENSRDENIWLRTENNLNVNKNFKWVRKNNKNNSLSTYMHIKN